MTLAMGAYDANPRNELSYRPEIRSIGNLADKFSGLGFNDSPKDNLFQIMKAVEAAESTIKQQVEENNHLRAELQKRTQELENYRSEEPAAPRFHSDGPRNEHLRGPYLAHQSESSVGSQHYSEMNQVNGALKVHPSGQAAVDNVGVSQFSSPTSFSSTRYQREGEYDPISNLSGHGLVPMSEVHNSGSLWKQDLVLKAREHEEEIILLRKHLAEYSIKEAQIRNEKYVLEKRIAYMRMAFDQQQQDLVDAASKAVSYRQDIIEENIRLTYALQEAQQERSMFVSSLLPLLADYSLQPPVPDAQSIVSNLKILFKHLQEKLIVTEAKLKESQYQLAPWRSDVLNHPSITPQSPSHPIGAALTTSNKNGLELVPQPTYSHGRTPISSPVNAQTNTDWDQLHHTHQAGSGGFAMKNLEPDNFGRSSPSTIRNPVAQDVPPLPPGTHADSHATRFPDETSTKQVSFSDLVSGSEMDDPDGAGHQNGREPSPHWGSGNSPYMTPTHDDPSSMFSPYLPPVLEEPSSSFSEAGEDDPLPAIEGLQISGEALPGRELQACGYSINGTTSCNFEWVRYLEDGSVNYIDGAKQPNYLITADDVDSYLAIEVQPLDDRKRKGELVKVFANDQGKITCDPEMQEQIEKTLYNGHASYEVSLSAGYLDIWELAILAIKREGYSIKCNGPRGVVVTEKFLPTTSVTIPYGHPTAFLILGSGGDYLLRMDSSSARDTIVLTMRLFIMRAGEKRKVKKKAKSLFFNK